MWPALVPGKTYWATSLLESREGDIVIAQSKESQSGFVIKKIKRVGGENYLLGGAVPWSSTYEVKRENIIGRLIRT